MIEDSSINALTLEFKDGKREEEYVNSFYPTYIIQVRVALVLGIFIYAGFEVVNYLLDQPMFPLNKAIMAALTLGVFALSFLEGFKKRIKLATVFLHAATGIGTIQMSIVNPHAIPAMYSVVIFFTVIPRAHYIYSIFINILIIPVFVVADAYLGNPDLKNILYQASLLLSAVACAIMAAYIKEIAQRNEFLQQEMISREERKSNSLLLNILPASIAERLKSGEKLISDRLPETTVMFIDIVNFTSLASQYSHEELVDLLNRVFSHFDRLVEMYEVEKIKTIGDAYMIVAGAPLPQPDHVRRIADIALHILESLDDLRAETVPGLSFRIGISTGSVTAGVIGNKKFIYDLWGDTVNMASRMESHGEPNRIHVSDDVYQVLKEMYYFEPRGQIEVKGKGSMPTYFLRGKIGGTVEARSPAASLN